MKLWGIVAYICHSRYPECTTLDADSKWFWWLPANAELRAANDGCAHAAYVVLLHSYIMDDMSSERLQATLYYT